MQSGARNRIPCLYPVREEWEKCTHLALPLFFGIDFLIDAEVMPLMPTILWGGDKAQGGLRSNEMLGKGQSIALKGTTSSGSKGVGVACP